MAESLRVSALLSLSGGIQDAYTYNLRDQVFANAQTGNVILMSQHFMQGDWKVGVHYLCPLLSFMLGIMLAEIMEVDLKKNCRLSSHQVIVLLEVLILCIVGFLPLSQNMLANALVSLSCAMQVQTFRILHGYTYASTMCIGNLRSGTESLSKYLRTGDKTLRTKALHYYGIILIFALGAGLGGILSLHYGIHTIWICCGLLLLSFWMMKPTQRVCDSVEISQ